MKRCFLFFVLLLITLCLLLSGCGKKTKTDATTIPGTAPGTAPGTEPGTSATEPVTEPETEAKAEYEIRWVLQTGIFLTTAKEGEIPVPPENYDDPYLTDSTVFTFKSWDKPLAAVTGNAVYSAQYDRSVREYDVTFTLDGVTQTVLSQYGKIPVSQIGRAHV